MIITDTVAFAATNYVGLYIGPISVKYPRSNVKAVFSEKILIRTMLKPSKFTLIFQPNLRIHAVLSVNRYGIRFP